MQEQQNFQQLKENNEKYYTVDRVVDPRCYDENTVDTTSTPQTGYKEELDEDYDESAVVVQGGSVDTDKEVVSQECD